MSPPDHLADARAEPVDVVELSEPHGTPTVSVVVATYNHRRFLRDLLDGLGRQADGPTEVVIVDDGSTDDTFEVLVRHAGALGLPGRLIRLRHNRGRSVARNVGLVHARAEIIAFTDSDCVPARGWLEAGIAALGGPAVGIVQGRTAGRPDQPRPLFNHFIEIRQFDGTFSTCNVFYRKRAIVEAGGFDPSVEYWEDLDLGWRVRRCGWLAEFAPAALVYHQVIRLSVLGWLRWPRHFALMPEKVAAYPEYRQYLFLGVWVHWLNALFDLALLSIPLARFVDRRLLVLAAPYVIAFPIQHGLRGKWPFAKAVLHLAWDGISFATLAASSARHRAVVL